MTRGEDDRERMRWEAFERSRLERKARTSVAHPEGVCTSQHVPCPGCDLPAPLGPGYCGSTMAHCQFCGSAWKVDHDPERCWQREDLLDLYLTEEHVTALVLARLELP